MITKGRTWIDGTCAKSSVVTWVYAKPEDCFEYISDVPRHSEWALDEIHVTSLTPGLAGLGCRYAAVGKQAGKEWPSQLEVTAYEPPARFEFTATGGPLDAPPEDPHRHEFLFTPIDGGTQIELRRTDPLPPSWPEWVMRLFGPAIIRATLRKRIKTVERLRVQIDQQRVELY